MGDQIFLPYSKPLYHLSEAPRKNWYVRRFSFDPVGISHFELYGDDDGDSSDCLSLVDALHGDYLTTRMKILLESRLINRQSADQARLVSAHLN